MGTVGVEMPECPVCLEIMSAPIYNCQSGHSLCASCSSNLCPSICPICRQPMTTMRNRALESIVSTAKVACPNSPDGCVYTVIAQDVENHLKECIFREMACPLAVFGKCSWRGKIHALMKHFTDHHPQNCNVTPNSDIELVNISVDKDDRHVFLVALNKMFFILTIKIDSIVQKNSYWIIQHIGSKNVAQQHVYEIQITSKQDTRRKVIFNEHCFNDAINPEEIFQQGKCGIVPLIMLSHFIVGKKLSLRFSINRIANPNQNFEKVNSSRSPSCGPTGPGPRGPGPRGPRPRGPGPHGASRPWTGPHNNRHKSPNPHSSGPRGEIRHDHPFHYKN